MEEKNRLMLYFHISLDENMKFDEIEKVVTRIELLGYVAISSNCSSDIGFYRKEDKDENKNN